MRELDLPPLSPYSVRYAGHGIERGKLSMDVNYKIAPDGQLTATNKLVLNQLQFGDEVQGAPASLPVRLAVALLADRNGVIDIDLPLSGSINDPQFSIGAADLEGDRQPDRQGRDGAVRPADAAASAAAAASRARSPSRPAARR